MPTHKVAHTFPLVRTFTGRASAMELAANDLWDALNEDVSVNELKMLMLPVKYKRIIDRLIDIKEIIGST